MTIGAHVTASFLHSSLPLGRSLGLVRYRGRVESFNAATGRHTVEFAASGAKEAGLDLDGDVVFELLDSSSDQEADADEDAPPAAAVQLHKIGRLVWARAAGHPWWPGEVCVPLAAELGQLALPAHTRDAANLVVFCGDGTFDWITKDANPFNPANPRPKSIMGRGDRALMAAVKEALDRATFLGLSTDKGASKPKKKKN